MRHACADSRAVQPRNTITANKVGLQWGMPFNPLLALSDMTKDSRSSTSCPNSAFFSTGDKSGMGKWWNASLICPPPPCLAFTRRTSSASATAASASSRYALKPLKKSPLTSAFSERDHWCSSVCGGSSACKVEVIYQIVISGLGGSIPLPT